METHGSELSSPSKRTFARLILPVDLQVVRTERTTSVVGRACFCTGDHFANHAIESRVELARYVEVSSSLRAALADDQVDALLLAFGFGFRLALCCRLLRSALRRLLCFLFSHDLGVSFVSLAGCTYRDFLRALADPQQTKMFLRAAIP